MSTQHQYWVGDSVYFRLPLKRYDYRAPGIYRVVRLRPSESSDCSYWIRSPLENFDRIAAESELVVIRPDVDARVSRRLVAIPEAFRLKNMEQERPGGVYEITTTEETLGDFMFEAFRRISTTIYLPPLENGGGIGSFIEIDPVELDRITDRKIE